MEERTQVALNAQSIKYLQNEQSEQRQDIRDIKQGISDLVELGHKQSTEIMVLTEMVKKTNETVTKSEAGREKRIETLTSNTNDICDLKSELKDRKKIDIGILLAVIMAAVKSLWPWQ